MSNSDLRFVSFNKYIRPEIKEYKNKGWVLNGVNNSFYKYVIDRYYGSATHSSVINSYIDLIYGKGLVEKDGDIESQEWKDFLKLFSKKDQKKVITDYEIFGEFSVQVLRKKGNRNELAQLLHIDKNNVVPSVEDELGNINSYWHSRDWAKQWQEGYQPKEYPVLGLGQPGETEIFVAKPYKVGREYFADPDYTAILPYAEFEEEVANYYLKYIKNGLSLGNIINVPNSVNWSNDDKDSYSKKVKDRLTGSENANSVIISFNGGEEATTIESIKNEYAHKQWDFLTVEARQQILTGHKATSPSLVGVISSSGFSNTAAEMDEAEHQLMKRVISPKQNFITESIREILEYFNQDRELMFLPLTEKEEVKDKDPVIAEKESNIGFGSDCGCGVEKKKSDLDLFIELGEDEDLEKYDIIDEIDVDYNENIELASTGTARPNAKSEQDTEDFIVRYRYVGNKSPEREFCAKMMAANKVYRKEDIIQMGSKNVNPGFGMRPNPDKPYSIWLYKGGGLLSEKYPGGTCKHKWNRVIYLKKGKSVDANSPLAQVISTSEARRRGYKLKTNETEVSVAPHNMK